MVRFIAWILIAVSTVWLVYRRAQKGSPMVALGFAAGLAVMVYAGLCVLLFVGQSKLLYLPWRAVESSPADIGLAFEDLRIPVAAGQTLAAWYIPAENARWTILFCHGNAGNMGHRLDTLALFHDLGVNCLIFDYRGYGQSSGSPTEEGTIQDALAAHRWLLENQHIPPERILFFGRSLGGAVAALAATRLNELPPAGLVVESAFTSFVDIGSHYYPWLPVRGFVRFSYDAQKALPSAPCPVLVIHSPDDEIIPFAMGRRLYEAARPPKRFAELKGTHNEGFFENLPLYRSIWVDALTFFSNPQAQLYPPQ